MLGRSITPVNSLGEAVSEAELVIEAVPENLEMACFIKSLE